jgi:integrase
MPTPVRKKNKGEFWWLRKKVPLKLRPIVGRAEVWRSLGTTDRRAAAAKCVVLSAELEAEWARLAKAARTGGSNPVPPVGSPDPVSQRDLHALAGVLHARTRDARIENPGTGFAAMRWAALASKADEEQLTEDAEFIDLSMRAFLDAENVALDDARLQMFRPLYIEARRRGYLDLVRASKGDFSPSPVHYPERSSPKLHFIDAFETYSEKGGLKGGKFGPTAKRWRPKIAAFCAWLGHRDLTRVIPENVIDWVDHLLFEKKIVAKSVRDVWLASLKATAGFMVERRKLKSNPFAGVRVRGVKDTKESNRKGFGDAQASAILTATLAAPSNLISVEMRAARRWVPWVCAYTGARVNEITSLLPSDIRRDDETRLWCLYLRPEVTKGAYERVIPIHSHLIDQRFLDYVEKRRRADLPLFYHPGRARGGAAANPQWQKVGERLGEWVRESLRITGVAPNHAWRHRFKSVARHVHMHPDVESFITGHGASDNQDERQKISVKYGDKWVKTLSQAIEKYPRYEIAALTQPPAPHKRVRRTPAQIAVDKEAREARRSPRQAA